MKGASEEITKKKTNNSGFLTTPQQSLVNILKLQHRFRKFGMLKVFT